jgi:hypothetical protein
MKETCILNDQHQQQQMHIEYKLKNIAAYASVLLIIVYKIVHTILKIPSGAIFVKLLNIKHQNAISTR